MAAGKESGERLGETAAGAWNAMNKGQVCVKTNAGYNVYLKS